METALTSGAERQALTEPPPSPPLLDSPVELGFAPPASRAGKPRNRALDVAKGIAIIAVVTSHVMRGAYNEGLVTATTTYRLADAALYLFHVQLFLLISGYLAFPRAADPHMQRNRQISLAYSYFLASAVSLTAMIVMHLPLPGADIPHSFLLLFYAPIQHFWFLPIIMVGFALLYGLRTRRALAAGIALCILIPTILGFSYYGVHYYIPFYLAGALLRLTPFRIERPRLLTAASIMLFATGILVTLWTDQVPTIAAMIPFSMAACYAVYRAAQYVSGWEPLARWLEVAGQASLPIFLTHIFFTAGARKLCMLMPGHMDAALLMPITLAAGVGGPILLDRLAARLGMQRLAGFTPLLK